VRGHARQKVGRLPHVVKRRDEERDADAGKVSGVDEPPELRQRSRALVAKLLHVRRRRQRRSHRLPFAQRVRHHGLCGLSCACRRCQQKRRAQHCQQGAPARLRVRRRRHAAARAHARGLRHARQRRRLAQHTHAAIQALEQSVEQARTGGACRYKFSRAGTERVLQRAAPDGVAGSHARSRALASRVCVKDVGRCQLPRMSQRPRATTSSHWR
jgi:hypothetical protein